MPKISSVGSKGLIIKFVITDILVTVISLLLFSAIISEVFYKLDLSTQYLSYSSVAVSLFSAFFISFFSVMPFKNNGIYVGMIAEIPLLIFSVINVFNDDSMIIIFVIKFILIIAVGALSGAYSVKRKKKIRVR